MRRRLTRDERIRRRPEFRRVQQSGKRRRGRYLTLFTLPNGRDVARLGIIATRRVGGAVRRNRAKRRVRELFRHRKGQPGVDIVVLVRPDVPDAPIDALEADYRRTLRNAAVRI